MRFLRRLRRAGMAPESLFKLKPKPVMHIAGEKDALVKFEWQQRTIERVRKLNGCDAEGKPWASIARCTRRRPARRWWPLFIRAGTNSRRECRS